MYARAPSLHPPYFAFDGATDAVDDVITKTSAPARVAALNADRVPLIAGCIKASGSSVAPAFHERRHEEDQRKREERKKTKGKQREKQRDTFEGC